MEMTIDEARTELISGNPYTNKFAEALVVAIDTMRKYQQLQADYGVRLKADMVAMLEELKTEIEELDTPNNGSAYMDCAEIIQQKIDKLREGEL